jgi:hypothetical protein
MGGVRPALAAWGGYADGNATVVAIVVVLVVAAAILYLARKLWRR